MDRLYKPTPDGYCGDEDNGQTSAWYVFSALGFYPVTPAVNQYVIGAPLFRKATLNLENGRRLVINAADNSAQRRYIKALRVNGRTVDRNWLGHAELSAGATLDFDMSATPNLKRVTADVDVPYSFSTDPARLGAREH
jgi:putative alpha-1,2-mannosidase